MSDITNGPPSHLFITIGLINHYLLYQWCICCQLLESLIYRLGSPKCVVVGLSRFFDVCLFHGYHGYCPPLKGYFSNEVYIDKIRFVVLSVRNSLLEGHYLDGRTFLANVVKDLTMYIADNVTLGMGM